MFKLLMYNIVLLLITYSDSNACKAEELGRRGRLFRNTYTTTVTTSQVFTSLIPSSCVQVEATLPPCRNVRFLKFPKLPAVTFNNPANEKVLKAESKIETTSLGWGEYFGLYAPTVTVATTELRITTVQDPSVVVTFAVKGCRPLKLPMDLDRCPPEYTSSVPIKDALQTSTVAPPDISTKMVLPTKTMSAIKPTVDLNPPLEKQSFQGNSNLLEPSAPEMTENEAAQPTETLVRS